MFSRTFAHVAMLTLAACSADDPGRNHQLVGDWSCNTAVEDLQMQADMAFADDGELKIHAVFTGAVMERRVTGTITANESWKLRRNRLYRADRRKLVLKAMVNGEPYDEPEVRQLVAAIAKTEGYVRVSELTDRTFDWQGPKATFHCIKLA